NGEREPRIPAIGPVLSSKFAVALKVQVSLPFFADRNDIADLWSNADHARLKAPDAIARAAVAGQLLVPIANKSDLPLLGQELRCTPIQMHIDAVLIIRIPVFEVVSEAECRGKFASGLLVEVSIGTASIDCVVPYTDISNRL